MEGGDGEVGEVEGSRCGWVETEEEGGDGGFP